VTNGKPEDKLGIRGSNTCEVSNEHLFSLRADCVHAQFLHILCVKETLRRSCLCLHPCVNVFDFQNHEVL
jgi:hypothetical protein